MEDGKTKRVFSSLNIALIIGLVGLSSWKQGNLASGVGYALAMFGVAGILIGLLLLGLYQFVRNVANSDNNFKPELEHRITASLIGAILATLVI